MSPEELRKPVTAVEMADAISLLNGLLIVSEIHEERCLLQRTRMIVQRMAYEIDSLRIQIDTLFPCNATVGIVSESLENPNFLNPQEQNMESHTLDDLLTRAVEGPDLSEDELKSAARDLATELQAFANGTPIVRGMEEAPIVGIGTIGKVLIGVGLIRAIRK